MSATHENETGPTTAAIGSAGAAAGTGSRPSPDLQSFLKRLDEAGELRRITRTVSPRLEVSEIAGRHAKRNAPGASPHAAAFDPARAGLGGEALLFESVEGCDFPLAINVFGSYRRMEMALGCDGPSGAGGPGGFEAIAARIASLTKPQPPRSLGEAWAKAKEVLPLLRTPPRSVRRAPCQEVVRLTERGEVDLTRLPVIKCWPHDGDPVAMGYPMTAEEAGTAAGEGRYITFAGMHTIHARDRGAKKPSSHNIGMYRSQLVDATTLVMHWHVHHDGAAHWRSWKAIGEPMPIAICLGGESVLPYAATAPLPPGIGELLMAGFLNGRGIPVVPATTVPLRVPAHCEIVIEGYVRTDAGPVDWDPRGGEPLGPGAAFEGPFGDHTGYYSMPDRYPLVEVTAITHRRDAVYPATIVGLPPQEDYYLGKATERIFLPLLRTLIHDIEDYHLPMFGCFHNAAFIRIDKQYPLQARRVMHAVWGAGQMAWTKCIVVVDEDVDVHDEEAVMRAVAARCDVERDVELVTGPLDILDHAAPHLGGGTKIGFDATTRWKGEDAAGIAWDRPVPAADAAAVRARLDAAALPVTRMAVPDAFGGRFCFVGVDKSAAGEGRRAVSAVFDAMGEAAGADVVIAVDDSEGPAGAADLADWSSVLFHWTANADPGRDRLLRRTERGARLGFDATRKMPGDEQPAQPVRPFPPILAMDLEVARRVDEHAADFGLP